MSSSTELRRLAARAWTLEATWTADRLQGWGVLRTLLPILRHSPDGPAALQRHAVPFGCNLWTVPAVLAAMAKVESERAGADAAALRDRVAPPLSAAGDVFVWRAMRPAALAVMVLGVLVGYPLVGLGVALVVHGAALARRWHRNLELGWQSGAGLESAFAAARPAPRLTLGLQTSLGLVAGGLAGWGVTTAWQQSASTAFLMSAALVVGYHAARRRMPSGIAFVGWVLLASLLGRFSNPLGPQ